jgi:hypothetical protein
MPEQSVIVWDLETIPDLAAVGRGGADIELLGTAFERAVVRLTASAFSKVAILLKPIPTYRLATALGNGA